MNPAVAAGSAIDYRTVELVAAVIAGRRDPSELPFRLWQLWADAFECGAAKVRERLAVVEAERDRLWYELRNPDEAKQRHAEMLKAFEVALARTSTAERWAQLDRIAAERSKDAQVVA